MNAVGFGGRALFGWWVALRTAIAVAIALTLAGAPTRAAAQVAPSISIVSGNNQMGTINSPRPVPLVVRVTIPSTVPIPAVGVTVTWTVTSGSGVLATSTSVTNANGEASNTLTPIGLTTGVTASVPGGASVTFNETAIPPFDYALTNSGGVIVTAGTSGATTITATLQAGATQPVSFTASVSFTGSGLPNGTTIAFTPTSCSPTCSTTLTITTSAATSTGTFPITVTGSPLGRTTSFNLVVSPPTLAIAMVSGNNQAGTINTPLPAPLVVSVTQNGVPVAGQTVTWTVSSGRGTLGAGTTVTDAGGRASNSLTPTGPSVAVTASIPGASVTFTATARPPAATITVVSGNNQLG